MKIYNVLWQDRHTDTTATPFRDLEEAKAWARKQAAERCGNHPDDFPTEETVPGWKFYIEYSYEVDCLWITEHEI